MLVLSRRHHENIVISVAGFEVLVSVAEIDPRGKVRLGFQADPRVRIDREEIHQLRQEQAAAAQEADDDLRW